MIGSAELVPTPDIVLSGAGVLPLHCRVLLSAGTATLQPAPGAQCWLNTVLIDKPAKLSQGKYCYSLIYYTELLFLKTNIYNKGVTLAIVRRCSTSFKLRIGGTNHEQEQYQL